MRTEQLSWTKFRDEIIISKGLKVQFRIADNNIYDIWAHEPDTEYQTRIPLKVPRSTDQIDFEDNFKSSANQTTIIDDFRVLDDEGNPITSTVPSSGKRALDVNVHGDLTATTTAAQYRLKFFTSKTEINLDDVVDTELANINFDGQLDGININFDRNDVEVVLSIDGSEILRIKLIDLENQAIYNLGALGATTIFPMFVRDSGKHFIMALKSPVDVLSNVTIKAKRKLAGVTKMKGIVVVYKQKAS